MRAALALGFALLVLHAARSGPDHDEIEHLHAAWLVGQGELPFRDFMEHHHPTLFFALAPLTRLLDGSPRGLLFAARLVNLGVLAGLLLAFARIARPLLRTDEASWPPLLLLGCFFFVRNSMEVRPDPWMCLLCLVGLWQWLLYLGPVRRLRHAALAGVCFGAAVAVLPKAVYAMGLVGLGTALCLRSRAAWADALRGAVVLLATALVPVGLLALAIVKLGILTDFVFWNYTFTPFHYWKTHFPGPSATQTLLVSVAESPLLWLAGLWGVGLAAHRVRQGNAAPAVAISAVVVVGLLVAMYLTRWPYGHNLLLMQPPLALLAVVAVDSVPSQAWRRAFGLLLLAMVAKVGVLALVYTENPGAEPVQRRLLMLTAPGTALAVPPPYNPVFRPNAFYFWFNAEYFIASYRAWCALHGVQPVRADADAHVWEAQPPGYVYVPEDEPSWAPAGFSQHRADYAPTDVPGLWQHSAATSRPDGR